MDHWDDGRTSKDRTITLSEDSTLTASYRLKSAASMTNSTLAALAQSDRAQLIVPVSYIYASSAQSPPSSTGSANLVQLLGIGVPVALAGIVGFKKYKERKDGARED